MSTLEVWGGVECTATRAHDRFVDQIRRSGHHDRIEDLDLFAGLGMTTLRYPVLWERVAPDHPDRSDWTWTDLRLKRLRELGINVIAGLVHHGGGPRYTNLLDDGFAPGVARHAASAARRYPWVEDWTPVNEPVTTARFSALYGVWYPHKADEGSFWRALLNEVDATRLAMKAVRAVNPRARLIQTDDLGRTYATVPLAEQAAFDNARRWMGWDLLFGRVTSAHPMWHRLCAHGFGERLRVIADDPCPPDVIGINHYLTSDRFLDHRLQLYPVTRHGGNGGEHFADLEPVRVLDPAPSGFATAIRDAWERYRSPIAITEVHNGCTREEQMRWAADAWAAATSARRLGIDIRAVTAWALLGSHDWDRLLVKEGAYEPGLFDLAGGTVRETALADLWRGLPREPLPEVARMPGWWRRPSRLLHPGVSRAAPIAEYAALPVGQRPLLILGSGAKLERALMHAAGVRGIPAKSVKRTELSEGLLAEIDALRPWAVIDTGHTSGAGAGDERELSLYVQWSVAIARWCADTQTPLVQITTDQVFDGSTGADDERVTAAPASPLGGAEQAVEEGSLAAGGMRLIVRTTKLVLDALDIEPAVATLRADRVVEAAGDALVPVAHVPALADALLDALIDGETGIRHLVHGDALSHGSFAEKMAEVAGDDSMRTQVVDTTVVGDARRRSILRSRRGAVLAPLDVALARSAVSGAYPLNIVSQEVSA